MVSAGELLLTDQPVTLIEVLARYAEAGSDRVFLQEVAGLQGSYFELYQDVRQWSSAYRRAGIRKGDRVAICLSTSLASFQAWLGCAHIGAYGVSIDPRLIGYPLEHVLRTCDAATIVTTANKLPALDDASKNAPVPRLVVVTGDPSERLEQPEMLPASETVGLSQFLSAVSDDDLPVPSTADVAAVIFTSGTSGLPRAALVHWAQLYSAAVGCMPPGTLGEDSALYVPFPDFHMSGKFLPFAAALRGGRAVIRHSFSATNFWNDVQAYGCTETLMFSGMAGELQRRAVAEGVVRSSLRHILMNPLPKDMDGFKSQFDVKIATTYGLTETGPVIATSWEPIDWRSCGRVTDGYPGYEVRIVDEHDYEVPAGHTGELILRASAPWAVSPGYLGRPEETARSWRNGWFHTGDAFRVDEDGNYFFIDRLKDCIRRRGENISSLEIETIAQQHGAVLECAAIAVEVGVGDDEVKLVASVETGAELTPEALADYLSSRMPGYMVPRFIEFVPKLPRSASTEKVQKHLLREDAQNSQTWDRSASEPATG